MSPCRSGLRNVPFIIVVLMILMLVLLIVFMTMFIIAAPHFPIVAKSELASVADTSGLGAYPLSSFLS